MEIKSRVIINKLVIKVDVLYQFYAICVHIISIKLYTNWKLLFKNAVLLLSIDIYLFKSHTDRI